MNEQESCEPKLPTARGAQETESSSPKASRNPQDAQGKLREGAEQTKRAANEIGDRVSDKASELADRAKEHGRTFLEQQKERVASEISAYSEAAQRAADRLESESDTNLSSYVTSAADHLNRLGNRIREQSLGGLVDDVEDIARQRPEVFYGGLFVAGLAAARFLKASKRQRQRDRVEAGSSSRSGFEARPARYGQSDARDGVGATRPFEVGAASQPSVGSVSASSEVHCSTSKETTTGGHI